MPPEQYPSVRAINHTSDDVEELRVGNPSLLGDDSLDLSDVLNTVLDKGAVVHGEVTIAVADVDLIRLNIGLLLQAIATAELQESRESREPPEAGTAGESRLGERLRAGSLAATLGSIAYPAESAPDAPFLAKSDPVWPNPGPGTAESSAKLVTKPAAASERRSLNDVARGLPERINADSTGPESGLARLVLTLIEVLRKVLEHQAVRRMEGGRLSGDEIERLGLALARLDERMNELRTVFGISEEELRIDLGPLGQIK